MVPAQNSHSFTFITALQQLLHIGIKYGQWHLQDKLDSLIEETVNNDHGTLKGHDTEKESEKPGKRYGGNHS